MFVLVYAALLTGWIAMLVVFAYQEYPNTSHLYDQCEPDTLGFPQFIATATNLAFGLASAVLYRRYQQTRDDLFFVSSLTAMLLCFASAFYHGTNNHYSFSGPIDMSAVFIQIATLTYMLAARQHELNYQVWLDLLLISTGLTYFCFKTTFYAQSKLLTAISAMSLVYYARDLHHFQIKSPRLYLLSALLVSLLAVSVSFFFLGTCPLKQYTHGATHIANAIAIVIGTELVHQIHQKREPHSIYV